MANRNAYLTAALDQLQTAIARKDTSAATAILNDVQSRYPADADVIVNLLITAGMYRATGGRR